MDKNLHKCIYCLREKEESEFNREHVIPQMMGTYNDNQVLNKNQVCRCCNTYFNDHFENQISKDSIESLLRAKRGNRKPQKGKKLIENRVVMTAVDGDFKGLKLFPEASDNTEGIVLNVEPCIGIWTGRDKRVKKFFKPTEFPERNHWVDCELDNLGIIWSNIEDDEALKILENKGYDVEALRNSIKEIDLKQEGEMVVDITGKLDETVSRLMSKVVFNYICYMFSKEYVLDKKFDPLREFIRFGAVHPSLRLGFSVCKLENFENMGNSHFVGLAWGEDYSSMYGIISWFNELKYTIWLSKAYGLKQITLPVSIYNNDTKTIEDRNELIVVNKLDVKPLNDELDL